MMLKRRTVLRMLGVCVAATVLSACTTTTSTDGGSATATKDARNETVYDHSELAWYIQKRYGVDEADCQFYAFDSGSTAYLLAKGSGASGGNHYVLRAFGGGVSSWYREGSWIVESTSAAEFEQSYNGKPIELVEFVYGNSILHMFVAFNDSGKIERLFVLSGSDDYYNKEGQIYIWEYDRNGRAKGLYHGSGLFSAAFFGVDSRGENFKDYGDYSIYTYDTEGRLLRVTFTSAKFSNNVISEIEGSAGIGVGSLEFAYDINGNRSSVTQDLSGVHQMVKFSRDASGKIVQVTFSESDLLDSDAESTQAKVTVTYRDDGSTEYSDPIYE